MVCDYADFLHIVFLLTIFLTIPQSMFLSLLSKPARYAVNNTETTADAVTIASLANPAEICDMIKYGTNGDNTTTAKTGKSTLSVFLP